MKKTYATLPRFVETWVQEEYDFESEVIVKYKTAWVDLKHNAVVFEKPESEKMTVCLNGSRLCKTSKLTMLTDSIAQLYRGARMLVKRGVRKKNPFSRKFIAKMNHSYSVFIANKYGFLSKEKTSEERFYSGLRDSIGCQRYVVKIAIKNKYYAIEKYAIACVDALSTIETYVKHCLRFYSDFAMRDMVDTQLAILRNNATNLGESLKKLRDSCV